MGYRAAHTPGKMRDSLRDFLNTYLEANGLTDTFGWVYPHDFLRSFRYLSSPFFPLGLFPILTSMEGIHSLDALVGDFLGRDGSVF